MKLEIVLISLRNAFVFVTQHHRHHAAPQGGLFAVAVAVGDEVVGVAIVGRPVSRIMSDGFTAEVTRLATTGERNGLRGESEDLIDSVDLSHFIDISIILERMVVPDSGWFKGESNNDPESESSSWPVSTKLVRISGTDSLYCQNN